MAGKNPYEVLGVDKNATQETIKKAYRDHARKSHPDKESGDADQMKDVNWAKGILLNPAKRAEYDTKGFVEEKSMASRVQSIILDLINQMLEANMDLNLQNPIEHIRTVAKQKIRDGNDLITKVDQKIAYLKKWTGKLKDKKEKSSSLIDGLVFSKIEALEGHKAMVMDEIELSREVMRRLEQFEFEQNIGEVSLDSIMHLLNEAQQHGYNPQRPFANFYSHRG